MKSPVEKDLEILNHLRELIDPDEKKVVSDINYCIKMISSNQLYEANYNLEDIEEIENSDVGG